MLNLNSIKKLINTTLNGNVRIGSSVVSYFEGFPPEGSASKNLIFTANNISTSRGIFDSKTNRGYNVSIPIYCNYRGQKTPENDNFTSNVQALLHESLNVGTLVDNIKVMMCSISSTHTAMQDAKGSFIQNILTLTIEVSEI